MNAARLETFAGADDLIGDKVTEQRRSKLTTPELTEKFDRLVGVLPADIAQQLLCILLATAVQRLACTEERQPR